MSDAIPTESGPDLGTKHQFHGVQPTLPVRDVARSVAYYQTVLGFEVDFLHGDPPTFGRVMKGDRTFGDPVYLRFAASPADPPPTAGEVAIHVGHDVDGLFAAYRALGVVVVDPIASQPWGLREFRVADLDGHVLRFAGYLEDPADEQGPPGHG